MKLAQDIILKPIITEKAMDCLLYTSVRKILLQSWKLH